MSARRRRTGTDPQEAAARAAAFERAWRLYGGPEPTEQERAEVDAQLEEGWALARKTRGVAG